MEEAIGSKISDYLIKPVENPHQILLAVKKILDNRRLQDEQAQSTYMRRFRELAMKLGGRMGADEWSEVYRRLMHWHSALSESGDRSMLEILENQHAEANHQFTRFVEENYEAWMTGFEGGAYDVSSRVAQWLPRAIEGAEGRPVFLVVIDNLRWDQWRTISPALRPSWNVVEEKTYFSILPTATQYARNALFAGMTPAEIARVTPHLWKGEHEQGSKNAHERSPSAKTLFSVGGEWKDILPQDHQPSSWEKVDRQISRTEGSTNCHGGLQFCRHAQPCPIRNGGDQRIGR